MDFWQHQDRARKSTRSLVVSLGLSVAAIIASIYLVVIALLPFIIRPDRDDPSAAVRQLDWWRPEVFLWVSGITGLFIGGASLIKFVELSGGGSRVAEMLGGTPLNPSTTDPHERRLLNVVEEMAIASGIPVPPVYLLPGEDSINAFAAGTAVDGAAIGVTRGGMQLLNRDELQGVVAHEFSHILNGDMKLNIRLIGILAGIVGITVLGRVILEGGRFSRSKNAGPVLLLGVALLIVGSVGLLCGRLIKAAVSRQREFLADASAVQFTRNPDGIAGALKKIGGLGLHSRIRHPRAEEASHLFFGNCAARSSWFSSLSTHPPLAERIRAIDPHFDGEFPAVTAATGAGPATPTGKPGRRTAVLPGLPDSAASVAALSGGPSASTVVEQVGRPTRVHLDRAAEILSGLPDELRAAAREPFSACALVYGILAGNKHRDTILADLKPNCHPAVFDELGKLLPFLGRIEDAMKLPLVDLALPSLKQMSREQFDRFRVNVRFLIEHDRQIDLFEYTLDRIIRKSLRPEFERVKRRPIQYYAVKPLAESFAVILSALASIGHSARNDEEAAFRTGAMTLGIDHDALRFREQGAETLKRVDEALDRLAEASPTVKKIALNAFAHTVAADGSIAVREAELLRAIADTLDCPIPPHVDLDNQEPLSR